jgi:hypothetical protein
MPPVDKELPIGCQQLIRTFNAFVDTKVDDGDPIHGDWQNKAIKTKFDKFRIEGLPSRVATELCQRLPEQWQVPGVNVKPLISIFIAIPGTAIAPQWLRHFDELSAPPRHPLFALAPVPLLVLLPLFSEKR